MKKFRKNKKRICAGILAFVLSASPILNDIPSFFLSSEAATYGDTMQAYIKDSGFRQYCIDGMSPNNALGVADRYVYVSPYASLSEAEAGQIFFALLSLEVSQGGSQDINKALNQLNVAAASIGLTPMGRTMSKDDLKLYLHSAAIRAKYPWVQAWSDNADKLLEAAGLLSSSSSGSTMGGLVPATLAGHTTPETAVAVDGTLSIKFAQDGSDAGFIQSVPLKFSATGEAGSYVSEIPNGWTYVKTDTEIIFTNPGNSPTPLYVQFDPIGTRYETAMGTFASARDLYEQCLQLWVLQQCAGQHKKFPRIGVVPAQQHQRLAYVEMALPSSVYYASVGASGVFGTGIFWGQQGFGGNGGNTPSYPSGTSSSGSLEFNCYRHEEDWTSTYNTQLTKYDHETGETLEESSFRLYERFDDKDQVNLERDGAVELYGGTDHETYLSKYLDNPVVWDDYRFVATVTTNEEGYASNTVEHKYHYDKTFCDGHPAPAFVEVPEEEEDEEGEVTNQDEIDEAKEENRRLASGWLECFDACDETASAGTYEGVHFHWLMSEVSQGEISSIASSGGEEGSTPNAGPTSSASGEDSYVNSGCKQDAEATYNKFIALKYSYTYQEDTARNGYILHDLHNDDLPIEVITTDSSENGANSFFANEYSNHIQINEDAAPEADSSTSRVEQGAVHSITESEYAELTGEDLDVPELEEEKKEGILSKAISFFTKIFKIEKEVELEETKAPERVDGSAADTKKSDDEEFQEHETVDGADETTDSDDIDNKNSSDSDGEILDSTEASDKDEEDQENKGEVENPDGGMSDTDSKDESEKNDSGTGSEDVAEKDSDTGNNSGDLENSDSVDDAASKEPDSAVGDVSARLETFEGKVFSDWIEKGIQKIFGIMTVYAETTENAAGSDIEKESVSARETKDDDSEDVSDEEERRPSKEETPIQDVVKDNRDLKNEENPSKEELADIDSEEFLDDDIEDEQEFIEDEERISEIEALGGRKVDLASDSNATYVAYVEFTKQRDEGGLTVSGSDEPDISLYAQLSGSGKELFESAYSTAKGSPSVGVLITPGSADNFSHCNDEDGCGNMWRIYDHRTEGEIHINKRDLDLENGANDAYDSYGDSQGDATLEGAVYGLFAAADIIHPDGKTGTVYMANDLVAVTTTDKNGDASFMAFTEAPGMIYDYEEGEIVDRGQGWNAASPQNLYDHAETYDEYTADADVVRTYPDYKLANGNCWIGRPLILGDYYVKELTRSEGYELSIGNRMQQQTNLGQDVNAGVPGDLTGYAGIVGILTAEEQISDEPTGDVEDPDYNQLFFTAESEKTGDSGFDLVFRNLPEGAKFYRKDSISTTKEVEAGTGIYDEVPVKNIFGLPEYVVTENDHQYPKYNADGSIKTKTTNVNFTAKNVIRVTRKGLDPAKVTDVILASVPGMSDDDLLLRLASVPDVDNDFALLKIKVEQALRTNGKSSPNYKRSGVAAYSSMDELVFDRGVWEGETDTYGISGVSSGNAADKTVCGSPLVTLTINKEGTDGEAVSLSSLIVSILDYYNTHDYYNYGGVDYIKEDADSWTVGLYANRTNYPMLFYVPADSSSGDAMFYRVASTPADHSKRPRAIYVAYSEDAIYDPRGEMKNFSVNEDGTVNAILSPAVQADENGGIVNGVVTETEFYKTGETPLDKNGNKIPKVTYVERTEKISVEVNECKWTEIPLTKEGNVWIAHQNGNYTDGYGTEHNDEAAARYEYTLKLPSRFISLTEQDCIDFGISKELAGTQVGSASYYLAKGSSVKAYLNYRSLLVGQENSYVQSVALDYPGQDYVFQDGAERPGTNTRKEPVGVEERIISQQIKVTKTIDEKSYRNTNSYSEVHEDWWSRLFGNHAGNGASDHSAQKLDNFRFKTYLKSNLEALYRNENGEIVWQDRMGTDRTDAEQLAANKAFPMLVNKIYTKVPHQTDPLFKKSNDAAIANTALYDYHNGLISDEANTGYTRLLETADYLVEDGDSTRTVKNYNYEKFFDAISVSNGDKWDENHPTYTSYKPIGNLMNRTEEQLDNARVSDRVRQFAISWYLDNEVKKLVQEVDAGTGEKEASAGATAYSEETYDLALRQAIIKAENYLKPFFAYDLDELYAIHWDSEANGGNDHDTTTLAANTIYGDKDLSKDGGYAYGLSKYLPYGTYVVAEQPPHVDELKDFKNRHYQIDQPREVTLPSVYASYDASQETPETLNSFYNYDCSDSMQQLEQKYQIRFGEEDHKIQAHNHHGDFEVYKYGLDLNEITNGVRAEAGNYFALTQSPWRPLKNYYNPENDRSAAEVTYYLTEGQSGRKGISENYRYSSLSEDAGLSDDVPYPGADITADNRLGIQYRDHVATMTGMQTAYEGKYAAMLVPYSVIASTDEQAEVTDEEPGQGGSASYRGFAYDKFVNRFFTAKLRIEKIDSETHENILHDGALFNLYAASRDDIESGQGTVKFTTEPTQFTGTKEFLTAMGATDIRPIAKGRLARWIDRITGKENGIGDLYSGTVPEGTPICSEDEQIVLGDEYGNKTVAFKTYSTTRDGLMRDEMTDQGASYQERYIDGQFITCVYDKTHKQTPVEDAERDRRNFEKTDIEHSMYVFKDGVPYLEITEGDFTKVKYRKNDKQLEVEAGTKIYHLDKDGYRDALVDPATGMAYIEEGCSDGTVRTLVWPVNVRKDEFGNVIARDKITTSRIATVAENKDGYAEDETLDVVNNSTAEIPDADKPSYTHAESGHITGTWKGNGEQSHEESSVEQNRFNQDMNGSVLVDDNDGDFLNELNPVYDDHGLVLYYQRSSETYKKGEDLYDRNGDFVRHQDSDNLEEYNLNAYRINEHDELYDASQEKKTPERKNLYHRLGEGYILENTWLSSDKTPNDPFDTFQTDGQADVLKRLPSGTYILEELKAPEGYVKGLPSGISVAETGELQHVQMVDRTTKIEISKIHAPQDTKMPVLDMDHEHPETGEKPYEREVVTGDIASYTYSSVSGAKLALYPARRVYSADTEKYPKGYYLVKTQNTPLVWEDTNSTASNPVWNTAEWISGNEPAYFERIPAGDYLLEEIETPEGFVTADPVEITVGDQSEVETVCMKNDTTKVEIEKFFTDEQGEKVQLSGAEFSLHQAVVNAEGEIIYDADGTPVYDARVLASFKSGTVEDYQNFRDAFEKAYASYGVDLSLFGWKENGQEKSATVTAKTVMDATSAGGSHDRFATKALLTMITSDGETIRVAVSGNLPETVFDYQFDYQKLEHINAYADTYLTDRGTRRINGLPAGEKYVLVETKAPDGFLKADAQVIVVENRKEIQQYHIEDLEGQIWLSKSAVGVTGEMAGATMALYRADQSGNLNQSDEYLVSQWVTGADGIYTVTDKVNGRIPEGYQVGDLRIHIETGLAEGIYYLVELSAPDYYTLAEPARFEYHLDDLVQTIRAVNEAVKGALSITKTGEDGQGLAGATFEIKAYKENDLDEPVTTNMIYGTEPVITVQDLPVGEMRPDGSIIPYTYTLQEIAAPEGYSVNPEIITWQFEPKQGDGQSFAHETVVIHQESVKDQKTRLYFSKQDFDVLGDDNTEGAFIDGAILSIYEVTGKDEHDQPVYDKDAPFTTWTTRKLEKRHKVIGLIAGHTYILVEDTAPKGWNLMKPVLFTVSSDGRSIQGLSNQMESIEIQRVSKNDYELDTINRDTTSIEQVKLKGRYVTQIYYELTDANKDLIESWIGAGEEHVIRKPFASVSEGSAYTITEYCRYSDGTVLVTDRFTKTFWFDENGEIKIPTREIDHVNETLSYADGTKITAFIPDADNQEKQVKNPLQKDDLVITRLSADGASALAPDQAIFERIRMINTDHKTADMVLTVTVDADTSIIDPGTGTFDGEKLVFHFESVAPGEAAYAAFTTQVSGEASTIEAKAEYNGIVRETQKTVPVLTYGKVVLFNELTGSGKERYKDQKTSFRVKLYDASTGRELPGTYSYSGSRTGMIKSGDTISLSGNEYVKIDPGYYKNVTYEIEKIENGLHHTEKMTSGSVDVTHGNGARFTRNIEDTAKRTIFKQGETYVLTEETVFANGDSLPTNKISTILGQSVNVEGIAAADRKTKVMISKTEIGGGKELPGCEMELYDEENNLIHRWTSSDVAESLEEFLEPGKIYRLVEKSPEPGYSYAEDITFTVNEDGTVDRVVMVDKPTHIVLSKKKITNSEELPGALLQVVDKDGNVVEEWISTDKPHEIVAKLVVDESYVLREVRPADGWAYAEDVPFKVSHDGTVDYVKMEDKPTHVVISKQEITGSKELPGCTLQVIDKNGNVVDEWFSTDQPHEIKEKLIADEEYTLREVRPADGWAYAEDIPFKVSHDGTVDQVKMEDKPTHVVVSKKKITGKEELPGCHLVIKDKNGNVVDEWTSSTIPHEIVAKLIAGETYTLIEIRPADGYSVAESIEFTVSKDGSVDMVEMFDDVTHVEFGKVNPNGTLLSGGQIQIKDLDGNVLVDFVPDGTVYRVDGVLKAGETYVIHEVSAPGGYRVSEDQEFIMPLGQETKEIRFVNFAINGGGGGGGTTPGKRQLSIRKYDPVNQIGVAGAKLTVYSADGSLYLKGITDESGYLTFAMPADGTYTYQETEAPAGYYLNPAVQYLYIKDGKVTNPENRTLYDYPNVEVILEKKDSEDGTAVPDTLLQVTDPAGQVVFHGRTDEAGACKVPAGKAGTYRIVEIEPANGYERSEAPWQFLVSYDGTIAGETTLYNEKIDKRVGIGRIYAHYESTNGSSGSYGLGVPDWLKQPKAGDTTDSFKWYVLATIFAMGAGGLVLIGRRKGKKKDDEA